MATDLSLPSDQQVLAQINADNLVDLSFAEVTFEVPTALVDDPEGRNTALVVKAAPNGGYVGDVTVKYNRLELTGFEQYGAAELIVPENPTLADVIEAFNLFYDANLSVEEDVANDLVLPDVDYVGKPFDLAVRNSSFAYTGTIPTVLRYSSAELSAIIANVGLSGLDWPTLQLEGNIELMTPSPMAISFHSAGVLGDGMLVYGGRSATGASLNTLRHYDFTTDSWSTRASNIARNGHASAVVDGRLYVFGGVGGDRNYAIYDPNTDTWTQGSQSIPFVMTYGNAVAVDRTIYLWGSQSTPGQLWRYNVDSGTWTRLADSGADIGGGGGAYHNGKLYEVGGYPNDINDQSKQLRIYDIATNAWVVGSSMPRVAAHIQAAVVGDYLYTFGGRSGSSSTVHDTLLRYDPATDTWVDYGDIGIGRRNRYSLINYQDALYLLGGATTTGYTSTQPTLIKIT